MRMPQVRTLLSQRETVRRHMLNTHNRLATDRWQNPIAASTMSVEGLCAGNIRTDTSGKNRSLTAYRGRWLSGGGQHLACLAQPAEATDSKPVQV